MQRTNEAVANGVYEESFVNIHGRQLARNFSIIFCG
jgi:hypothetical protein